MMLKTELNHEGEITMKVLSRLFVAVIVALAIASPAFAAAGGPGGYQFRRATDPDAIGVPVRTV